MSWSWLRSPRWISLAVLIVVAAVVCVNLGFWQLRRLDEKRSVNERAAARLDAAPVSLDELAEGPPTSDAAAEDLEFTPVTVTGTYVPEDEVLLRSQSYRGQSGYHVLTPLRTETTTVLVRRGWVPFEMDDPPLADAPPPADTVTVTGFLEQSRDNPDGGFLVQTDPETGVLDRVFHADVHRIDQQVDAELFPMLVHLEGQQPATPGDLPVAVPRPAFDEGNHLSYAFQWFSFAAIAVIGFGVLAAKKAREEAEERAAVSSSARSPHAWPPSSGGAPRSSS